MGRRWKQAKLLYNMKAYLKRPDEYRQGGFFLCYQPMLDSKTDKIVAAEALIRWSDKTSGTVEPDAFIPLAEKTKLIIPLGEWVIENSCRQVSLWHAMDYKIAVSVNVSAVQLHQPEFAHMVSRILGKYSLASEYLVIEITEQIAIGYDETVNRNLEHLSQMGIRIAADDFGTGYNSFRIIQSNRINILKIDKNFTMDMQNEVSRTIIDMIFGLGHKLNMSVTAEGVEKKEHYEYLKKNGCDMLQGYYISKPLPGREFMKYMKHRI